MSTSPAWADLEPHLSEKISSLPFYPLFTPVRVKLQKLCYRDILISKKAFFYANSNKTHPIFITLSVEL